MDILNHNEQSKDIVLTPQEVESAVRQFIVTCHPEYAKDWLINAKYNTGAVVVALTKV
jgi:hypothetical protein